MGWAALSCAVRHAECDSFRGLEVNPMSDSEQSLKILQKFVDGFSMDVGRVRAALDDEGTSPTHKKNLVGALNYLLDRMDMFPDHYKGIGFADDAMVLRIAAAQAVGEGAGARGLLGLAKEVSEVNELLGDLEEPVAKFVASLATRTVRGRTPEKILSDKDTRAVFDADLTRMVKAMSPETIDTSWMGSKAVVDELRKMIRHALKKEGFLK